MNKEYTRKLFTFGSVLFESERIGPVDLRRQNPRVWREAENFGFKIGVAAGLFIGFVAACGLLGALLP